MEPFAPADAVMANEATGALQEALLPPFSPPQLHVQGPVPDTELAVPIEQRLVAGAERTATPLAEPQEPLTLPRDMSVQIPLLQMARLSPESNPSIPFVVHDAPPVRVFPNCTPLLKNPPP